MLYNANTARISVTLSAADLYAAHVAEGHPAALRIVRRAAIRAAVKADPACMRDVHAAMLDTLRNVDGEAPANVRTAVNAAGRSAVAAAVRIAPSTLDVDGMPYAPGMIRAAIMVARKTLVHACEHGGTDTQRAALQDMDIVHAAAVRYDVAGLTWEAAAPAILAHLATVGHDAQDMYAAAMAGLTGGYTIPKGKNAGTVLRGTSDPAGTPREHIRAAYLTANAAIHKQKAASLRDVSTEFVREQGGDLVAVGTAIARIVKGDERWTLSDVVPAARVDVEALRVHLPHALALCRPVHREIAILLARGYSVAAIAEKTGRDRRTVQRNIAIMRGTCVDYLREHAPAVLPMVDAMTAGEYTAAQTAARDREHSRTANSRRTEEGKARAAACKAAYRERKKAERAAAAANN